MTTHLASWRNNDTKKAITKFVEAVTDEGSESFVPASKRIAVFDNDGTLWAEKPLQVQLFYILEKWKAAVDANPELAANEPYKGVASGDLSWMADAVAAHYAGDESGMAVLIQAIADVTDQMSVLEYEASVKEFFSKGNHPLLRVPFKNTTYAPMIELLRYLEANDFKTYIVSGGDRDFMRPITEEFYGIPAQRVVGTGTSLTFNSETNEVHYLPKLDFFSDGPEKPVRIWMRTGQRPILAAGNSNGDLPMLKYTLGSPTALALLLNHDDETRNDPPYRSGAEQALTTEGLTVISVKDDWETIFTS